MNHTIGLGGVTSNFGLMRGLVTLSNQILPLSATERVSCAARTHPSMSSKQDQPPDRLSALPTKLRCAIARRVVALNDRKALVLVNKACAEVTLSFLWNTLTTDLVETGSRDLVGLAHRDSNIIKHVQSINLVARSLSGTFDHLATLLASIPRGQLRRFKSVKEVSFSTIDLLLRLHPDLEALDIGSKQAIAYAMESPWAAGSLSKLKSMDIYVDCFTSKGFQNVWNRCISLKSLKLRRWSSSTENNRPGVPADAFISALDSNTNAPTSTSVYTETVAQIEGLYIGDITLPKSLDMMFRRINVLNLHTLILMNFTGTCELLESMASQFSTGKPCLETLMITELPLQATSDFNMSLSALLTSFSGLTSLELDCTDCHKFDVRALSNHG